jgi:hypothetical protein
LAGFGADLAVHSASGIEIPRRPRFSGGGPRDGLGRSLPLSAAGLPLALAGMVSGGLRFQFGFGLAQHLDAVRPPPQLYRCAEALRAMGSSSPRLPLPKR